jgi:5-methylcytosine-specific restriction enzyme subunit McrC
LNEIAAHFEDVQSISASDALATNIVLDRSNRRWETAVTLARLLLSSTYQATHRGTYDGVSLLFDMNLLFEEYVASLARTVCVPLGYTVKSHGPHRCLARSDDGQQQAFYTKPDLHIERDGFVMILDTKWKHIDPRRPNFNVTQSDAYQMHCYAHVYGSTAAVLLYPHSIALATQPGSQAEWRFESNGAALKLATIDVTKADEFAERLRAWLADLEHYRPIHPTVEQTSHPICQSSGKAPG